VANEDTTKFLKSSTSHVNPDIGVFWRIVQQCEIRHFSQFGSYLWEN